MTVLHCCTMLTAIRRRGRFLLFVFVPLVLFGCEAMLPFLSAAAPVAATGIEAYAKTIEAAKAKGATEEQLAEIRIALTEILKLEREHAARCEVAKDPPPDPVAAAKILHDKAVAEERLALARDVAATLLTRLDAPKVGADGGTP